MRQDFSDDDIKFGTNDLARELARAATYLRRQMDLMIEADALTADEMEHAIDTREHLERLENALDERATRELLEEASVMDIAQKLDGIYDLSGDVMDELDTVSDTIDYVGFPNTNPAIVADEYGAQAKEHADALRSFASDAKTEDC